MDIIDQIHKDIGDGLNITDKFDKEKICVSKVVFEDVNQEPLYIYLDGESEFGMLEQKNIKFRYEPIIPYKKIERWIIGIFGKSGEGKTIASTHFIKQFHILHPHSRIYYICSTDKEDDIAFKGMDYVRSINPRIFDINNFKDTKDADEAEKEMYKSLFSETLIVFDDLDMASKELKPHITRAQSKLTEIGRKMGANMIVISHINTNGQHTKMLNNELDLIVCFKGNIINNRLLNMYQGFSNEELRTIKTNSWVCFNTKYNLILTPTKITTIQTLRNQLEDKKKTCINVYFPESA